ncbi:hypothetical protein [Pseudomonas sp. AP3_22 TE3818]
MKALNTLCEQSMPARRKEITWNTGGNAVIDGVLLNIPPVGGCLRLCVFGKPVGGVAMRLFELITFTVRVRTVADPGAHPGSRRRRLAAGKLRPAIARHALDDLPAGEVLALQ